MYLLQYTCQSISSVNVTSAIGLHLLNCVPWREREERGTHPLASLAFFSIMTGSHSHGGSCTENRLVYTCFFLEGE